MVLQFSWFISLMFGAGSAFSGLFVSRPPTKFSMMVRAESDASMNEYGENSENYTSMNLNIMDHVSR